MDAVVGNRHWTASRCAAHSTPRGPGGLASFTVAIPFIAPIFSAYGVSYPACIRTFIRVHTDVGLVGIGEAGGSALHATAHGDAARRFAQTVAPAIVGESPFDYRVLRRLNYSAESIAVELACWDLMGKAAGVPIYRLLGGEGMVEQVPIAAYAFFRGADANGRHAVDLENGVAHVTWLMQTYGFSDVKLKLGVYHPLDEANVVGRVREAVGPKVGLRIDPNGCWSLATAKRMLGILEPLRLEYVEEPIKYVPARVPYTTQGGVPSLDTAGLAALRRASTVPIGVDGAYRIDLLRQVERDQAADVVLGDLQGAHGIRGLHDFFTLAAVLGLPATLHSGTELGVQQAAKLHVAAAHPEARIAGDAIYPEYVDDVLVGGKLPIVGGQMPVPQGPGLDVGLDEERLARYALTPQKLQEFDQFWRQVKADYGVGSAGHDLLVRHY